jgi:two-component system, OmpR family, sensor kinase
VKSTHSGSLAFRLTAVGLVQLLVVALTALGIGFLVARQSSRADMDALTRRVESTLGDPAALRSALDKLAREDRLQVSVYDRDQRLIAANSSPPLPLAPFEELSAPRGPHPPPPGPSQSEVHHPEPVAESYSLPPPPPDPALSPRTERSEPGPGPGPPHSGAFIFGPPKDLPSRVLLARLEDGVVVVARFPPVRPGLWTALLTLGSGLGVVAMGAILMARFITRPITRLSHAVRAFGEGDLQARASLARNDELGVLGKSFDEMAGRIQTLLRAEKELLANVAHELRTPLARIRVALDIAEESERDIAHSSLLEIGTDLKELETLLEDILTAARLSLADGAPSAAQLSLRKENIEAAELAERAARRFSMRHPQRRLQFDVAPDLPRLEVDPVLFRRVLDNLLDNAHKYTPNQTTPITLRAEQEPKAVRFEVADLGVGIAEAEQASLFTPFFRAERSRSRATGGVGLGLTLAKRIVEAHKGNIDIESQEGVGTRVFVRIPFATPLEA